MRTIVSIKISLSIFKKINPFRNCEAKILDFDLDNFHLVNIIHDKRGEGWTEKGLQPVN